MQKKNHVLSNSLNTKKEQNIFSTAIKERGKIREGLKNTFEKNEYVEQIAKQRLEICGACNHYSSLTKQCKLCGCFMFIKARSMSASCAATMNKEPKKWEAVMSEQEAYSEGYNEILKTYIEKIE